MPMGIIKGMLEKNINNIPEDKLREDLKNYAYMMLSWIGED